MATNAKTTDGWTVDQGLAAQYAAQAGVDPDLAAGAGEAVWDVLKSLRDATGETDPRRQAKLVKRTKARLAKANLSRHGELVQHIEAKLLALQGRGGDTELAHMTPGEVIVPPQLQTPEVIQALQQAAHTAGIDMARYTAGSPASSVNPETGMAEYTDDREMIGPIRTMIHRFIYDGAGNLLPTQPGITSFNGFTPGNSMGAGGLIGSGIGADIGGGYGLETPDGEEADPVLGQIIPDQNSLVDTVPIPNEGDFFDLSDGGLDKVVANPEIVPDNVLEWALDESKLNWKTFYFGADGQSLVWGNPLGGRKVFMNEHQKLYANHLSLLTEKQRRIDNGAWSLE